MIGFKRGTSLGTDSRRNRFVLQAGFGAVLLILWHVGHLFLPRVMPTAVQILSALGEQIEDGSLVDALTSAFSAIFVGFILAVVGGVLIGLFMGLSRWVERFLDPYVNGLYVTPFEALVPAMIVWFGTGFRIRVAVIVLFAIFPVIVNTLEGVKTAPRGLVEAARSFGAGRLAVVRRVILPHEVSYLVAGVRLAMGRAVKGLVVTELLVAVTGFGAILNKWSAAYRMAGVYSIVGVLMLIGVVLAGLVRQVEKRVAHWETSR